MIFYPQFHAPKIKEMMPILEFGGLEINWESASLITSTGRGVKPKIQNIDNIM